MIRRFISSFVLATMLAGLFPMTERAVQATGPWDDWDYRITLKVNPDEVEGSGTLEDFTMLLDLSDLPASFFDNIQSDGGDIVVTDASLNQLDRELDDLNAAGDTGFLWFKGDVHATLPTIFYLYYGNAAANETDAATTWGDAYAVYHLGDDPTAGAPQVIDSSSSYDGTIAGTWNAGTNVVPGKVGNGYFFDGVDDTVDTAFMTGKQLRAFSFWFYTPTTITSSTPSVIPLSMMASGDNAYICLGACSTLTSGEVVQMVGQASNSWRRYITGTSIPAGWNHFVFQYDQTSYDFILNGVHYEPASSMSLREDMNLRLARFNSYYDVTLDEVRYSSSSKTVAWFQTEYNNVNDPTAFFDFGTPMSTASLTGPSAPSLTASLGDSEAINPVLTSSAYAGAYDHYRSDWRVTSDDACSTSVWYANDYEGLQTATVNSYDGYFTGDLTGQNALAYGQTYYACVRYYDDSGVGAWSAVDEFTVESLDDWTYVRDITINNTSGGVLTDYQQKVTLNSTNFDFSLTESNGADVRFGSSDGVYAYPAYRTYYDGASQIGDFWVRLPSLATGSNTFKMYYGNAEKTTFAAQTGLSTFLDFWDENNFSRWTNGSLYTGFNVFQTSGDMMRFGDTTGSVHRDAISAFGGQAGGLTQFTVETRYSMTDVSGATDIFNMEVRDANHLGAYSSFYTPYTTNTKFASKANETVTNFAGTTFAFATTFEASQAVGATVDYYVRNSLGVSVESVANRTLADTDFTLAPASFMYLSSAGTATGQMADASIDFIGIRRYSDAVLTATVASASPVASAVSASQRTNGVHEVPFSFTVSSPSALDTLQAKVEYSVNGGSTWNDATLDTSVTATHGAPSVDNAQTYQIGQTGAYILGSSGANTIQGVWLAGTDLVSTTNISNARLRVTAFDGTYTSLPASTSNFIIDFVSPVAPTSITVDAASTSLTLEWTPQAETNFAGYQLWYGTNESDVLARTGTALVWDSGDDAALATRATDITTLSALTPETLYYLSLCATDAYGHIACRSASGTTGSAPTVSDIIVEQKTDGTGVVDVRFTFYDSTFDDNGQVRVELSLDGGASWVDPVLDTTNANTTASYGDPKVDNSALYQIGTSSGYIITSLDPNYENIVQFDLSASNFTGLEIANAQVRLTPYDGDAGLPVTSANFVVDTIFNTPPTNFNDGLVLPRSVEYTWDAAEDANFDHYTIWYGLSASDVTNRLGTAVEFDHDPEDPDLAFQETTSTMIGDLSPDTSYYAQLCGMDYYGNSACSAVITFDTPNASYATNLSGAQIVGSQAVAVSVDIHHTSSEPVRALVEYSTDGGATWAKATLNENPLSVSATQGEPIIENDATHPLGGSPDGRILTSGGTNTVEFEWLAGTDLSPTSDSSNYRLRVTPVDDYFEGVLATSSAITIDYVAPNAITGFAAVSSGSSTMDFIWDATSDTNFKEYLVYYGTNEAFVEAQSGGDTAIWTQEDDAFLDSVETESTRLTSLRGNRTYYAMLCAVDDYGNETCSDSVSRATSNQAPTLGTLSALQQTNGSAYVMVNIPVSEADADAVNLKIEYSVDEGTSWQNATLVNEISYLQSSYGSISYDALEDFAIRNVPTHSGVNTVSVAWDSLSDETGYEMAALMFRVTPQDATENGSSATVDSVILDQMAPRMPLDFSNSAVAEGEASFTWTPAVETYFANYTLWYAQSESDVLNEEGTALEWTSAEDADLASQSTSSTTITGLLGGTSYYVKLCAQDAYGLEDCTSAVSVMGVNQEPVVTSVSAMQVGSFVSVIFDLEDADQNSLQAKVEYSMDDGATWLAPSLMEETLLASYGGTPSFNSGDAYPIGAGLSPILSNEGSNTIQIDWDLAFDEPEALNEAVLMRVTAWDGEEPSSAVESASFEVDLVAPSVVTDLAGLSEVEGEADLTWTASSDTNFYSYILWYGLDEEAVNAENSETAVRLDLSDEAALGLSVTEALNISGLLGSRTYFMKMCAEDTFGNESCSPVTSFVSEGARPYLTSLTAEQNLASRTMSLYVEAYDQESDTLSMSLEYSMDGGDNWVLVTGLSSSDVSIDEEAEMFIQNIVPVESLASFELTWDMESRLENYEGNILFRAYVEDAVRSDAFVRGPFTADTKNPGMPLDFTLESVYHSTASFTWTPEEELSFAAYTIWYGQNEVDVFNQSGTALSWSVAEDSDLSSRLTSETLVMGLVGNTSYYVMLCAEDDYTGESCTEVISFASDSAPDLENLLFAQRQNGTGLVDLQFTVSHAQNLDTIQAKLEYSLDGEDWFSMTLSEDPADVVASFGEPAVSNVESYQIGGESGYIVTSSGANTVSVLWNATADLLDYDGTIFIRATAFDGDMIGDPVGSTEEVDLAAPDEISNFRKNADAMTSAGLAWIPSMDSHFSRYRLWYGTSAEMVEFRQPGVVEWNQGNDPQLLSLSTGETVVTGLTHRTNYFAMICAEDSFGYETCSEVLSFYANEKADLREIEAEQVLQGAGLVEVSFDIDTLDNDDVNVQVEYSVNSGAWSLATLSENPAHTSSVFGNASVDAGEAYSLRDIEGGEGVNTILFQWDSAQDIPGLSSDNVRLRFRTEDGLESSDYVTSSSFSVDVQAPLGLSTFHVLSHNSGSITYEWEAVEDDNFFRYEIWIGQVEEDVENRTGTALRWDDGYDADLGFMMTDSSTITGLDENTNYYAKIWAKDIYFNETSASMLIYNNNGRPLLSNLETTWDYENRWMDVSVEVEDYDLEEDLELRVEYNLGFGWFKATLDPEELLAAYGTPTLSPSALRQISDIDTSLGSNTLQFRWLVSEDIANGSASDNLRVRVIPYDSIENGSSLSSSTMVVDFVNPVGLSGLEAEAIVTSREVTLNWTPVHTEAHFSHYTIYYSATEADLENPLESGASIWSSVNDTALSAMNTATTTVTELPVGQEIFFVIYAYDDYGNEASAGNASMFINLAPAITELTARPLRDGSSQVELEFVVDDEDRQTGLQVEIEYRVAALEWQSLTVADSSVVASYGASNLAAVSTAMGGNRLQLRWNSLADEIGLESNQISYRVRVSDAYAWSEYTEINLQTLDQRDPVTLGALTGESLGTNQARLTWNPVTSEAHFDQYRLWYGQNADAVSARSEAASLLEYDLEPSLELMGSSTLDLHGLSTGALYYFLLVASDDYGHETVYSLASIDLEDPEDPDEEDPDEEDPDEEDPDEEDPDEEDPDDEDDGETPAPPSNQDLFTNPDSLFSNMGPVDQFLSRFGEWKPLEYPSLKNFPLDSWLPKDWSKEFYQYLLQTRPLRNMLARNDEFKSLAESMKEEARSPMNRGEVVFYVVRLFGADLENQSFEWQFIDITKDTLYQKEIQFAKEEGLIQGYADKQFKPEASVNRAEALKILFSILYPDKDFSKRNKALLAEYGLSKNPFSDVNLMAWYAPYLLEAYSLGIVEGYADGEFKPERSVQYNEFVKILAKLLALRVADWES